MTTKPCKDCGEVKPLDEFYSNGRGGTKTLCKPCDNARRMAWNKANPDRFTESVRRRNLKIRYGITVEQYDELFAEQDGRCACCGTTEPGGNGAFNVDHCHESDEIRGLLCNNCNRGIGLLGDDMDSIWNAILYLVRHEHKELTA